MKDAPASWLRPKTEMKVSPQAPMKPKPQHSPHRFAHPQRISITLAQQVFDALVERSQLQGRSMSNLAAYLLEAALSGQNPHIH